LGPPAAQLAWCPAEKKKEKKKPLKFFPRARGRIRPGRDRGGGPRKCHRKSGPQKSSPRGPVFGRPIFNFVGGHWPPGPRARGLCRAHMRFFFCPLFFGRGPAGLRGGRRPGPSRSAGHWAAPPARAARGFFVRLFFPILRTASLWPIIPPIT